MTAVDTNVLVRLLTGDDPRQTAVVKSIFAAGPVWIAKTVLLETAWVLRSLYGFKDPAIADAFAKLLGLPHVHTEDEASIAAALEFTARGIEIADALHLVSRPAHSTFVSFDRSLVKRANRAGDADVAEPHKDVAEPHK